ncbi:WD40-repeat-containing domain protein, partial [Pyrenochaeta sp. MPI-SDFR-AT-0127]
VAFSHDSTWLALTLKPPLMVSGCSDLDLQIWDTRDNGMCLKTLAGHKSQVSCVAFPYDSTRLASGSSDNIVKIWD